MSILNKTTFKKIIREIDPQGDFDNFDNNIDDDIDSENVSNAKAALYGAALALKSIARGGIGGALLGTAISWVTDGKIDEGAYLGAKIGISIDVTIFFIRLAIHSIKPQD